MLPANVSVAQRRVEHRHTIVAQSTHATPVRGVGVACLVEPSMWSSLIAVICAGLSAGGLDLHQRRRTSSSALLRHGIGTSRIRTKLPTGRRVPGASLAVAGCITGLWAAVDRTRSLDLDGLGSFFLGAVVPFT